METDLSKLERSIKYHFNDRRYLDRALTHSSYANENHLPKHSDYERLEFLGDAVLELISSDYLYHKYPDMPEGDLTRIRASKVCEPALAVCARNLSIDRFIKLGRGEESTGGRKRDSIISDVCEAVIGGIYLDGGLDRAGAFILEFIMPVDVDEISVIDAKSRLQELAQSVGSVVTYELISESGPDHDRIFEVNCLIDDRVLGCGTGKNKKGAQQAAARDALRSYHVSKKH